MFPFLYSQVAEICDSWTHFNISGFTDLITKRSEYLFYAAICKIVF